MRIPTTTLVVSAFLIFCCLGAVLAGKEGKRRRMLPPTLPTIGAALVSAAGPLGTALAQASTSGAYWAPAVWDPDAAGNSPGTTALAAGAVAATLTAVIVATGKKSKGKRQPPKVKPHRTVHGPEFMIYRNPDGDVCEREDPESFADSIVFRYARLVGFRELGVVDEVDEGIAQAQAIHRKKEVLANKSQKQVVTNLSRFERFCKKLHPENPYTIYLNKLEMATQTEEKVEYQSPSSGLVEAYICDMRGEGPKAKKGGVKGATVKAYVGAISAAHSQFGFGLESPTNHPNVRGLIKKYRDNDGTDSTASFNFLTDLPKIHSACWSMHGWADRQRLMCWSMFLVAICLMARASELTEFCPTYENITLPPVTARAAWDKDGFPKWIGIALTDWKHRSTPNKNIPYEIRIYRNYLDPRFCPVLWLLKWLVFSGIKSGPIYQTWDAKRSVYNGASLKEDVWTGMTTKLFTVAGLYFPEREEKKGCTNHAIRKSAVQWAARCGGSLLEIRNNGRWKSFEDIATYYAQGMYQSESAKENVGEDGIRRMWVWKPVTAAAFDGRDQL